LKKPNRLGKENRSTRTGVPSTFRKNIEKGHTSQAERPEGSGESERKDLKADIQKGTKEDIGMSGRGGQRNLQKREEPTAEQKKTHPEKKKKGKKTKTPPVTGERHARSRAQRDGNLGPEKDSKKLLVFSQVSHGGWPPGKLLSPGVRGEKSVSE